MTPNEWKRARVYEPADEFPPPPQPDRLSGWLSLVFWLLAGIAGALILAWAVPT